MNAVQTRVWENGSLGSSRDSGKLGRQQRPSCQCWSEVTVLFSAATLRNVPVIILFFLLPSSPALQTSFFSPAFSPVPLCLTTLPPHTHGHLIQLILSVNAPTGRQHPRVDRCILLKTWHKFPSVSRTQSAHTFSFLVLLSSNGTGHPLGACQKHRLSAHSSHPEPESIFHQDAQVVPGHSQSGEALAKAYL